MGHLKNMDQPLKLEGTILLEITTSHLNLITENSIKIKNFPKVFLGSSAESNFQ